MKKVKKSKEVREKEKNSRGLKIQHNKKLFWVIITLLIVLILLIFYIRDIKENAVKDREKECNSDEDCIPKECCHPGSCVKIEDADICDGIVCSAVCSGPLDCEAGYCGCAEGKCKIIPGKR